MPNQYYNKIIINGETKIDLTGDTVADNKLLSGYTAHDRSGAPITGTCTYDVDSTDANAVSDEILATKTAYVQGSKITGAMPNRGNADGTISTVNGEYVIQNGYHDGSGKVGIDATEKAKIVASNIRGGVTILGVEGTMSGTEDVKAQTVNVTPSFVVQTIVPDASQEYNYLAQVNVAVIPTTETANDVGGITLTVG
jgi:hypothetical protein